MSAVNIISATVDLAKGIQMVRLGRLFAANDKAAHTINVRVLDDGKVADLTGQTISAYFIRPDNATVTIQGTLSGNVASVTLPSSCYANSGHFSLIIKAVSTNTTTAIFWGDGTITRSTTDTIVDPENIIPSLEELLAQIEVMEEGTAAALAAAESANTNATRALNAAVVAEDASTAIEDMTVAAQTAAPNNPSATISTVDDHWHILFGLPTGAMPVLSIGTVTTLPEESNATVTKTGTNEAPVLNFGIPRGRTGTLENAYATNINMTSTSSESIYTAVTNSLRDAIEVTLPNVSSENLTFTVSGITPNHELVQDGYAYLSNPYAFKGSGLTLTTGNGEIVVSGTFVGTTDIKATFCIRDRKATGTAFIEDYFEP